MKNSQTVHRGLLLAVSATSVTLASLACSASLTACGGDDDAVPVPTDASTDASMSSDAIADHTSPVTDAAADHTSPATDGATDGGLDAAPTGDAAAARHILVTQGDTDSTLASYAIDSGMLEGTTPFSGGFGAPANAGTAPFLLEQEVSVVARLDATSPWKIDSSWNVLGTDLPAAGYTDPYAVVVTAGTKAYVLRYTRNLIDVIDPSQTVDGGAPTSTVDLGALAQVADTDGVVEMTNGFYDPTTKRLWVVLENINRLIYPLPCSAAVATVIAIDTTTDTLVSLGGSGPGGAYAFTLVDPMGMIFDSANDRIIAAAYGCQNNEPIDAGDGGDAGSMASGPVIGAGIEAISLKDGTSTVLFQASAVGTGGRGGELVSVGGTDAVAGFTDSTFTTTGYLLDLSARTVKSTLPVTPSAFVSDGAGHLYGTSYAADGGSNQDLIEVDVTDGSSRVVAASVVTDPSGFVGGVALW